MDELRKNHILHIQNQSGLELEGIVIDFEPDRVMVKINDDYVESAKSLDELDDVKVSAQTHFGLKMMDSCVISTLDKYNCLVIENTPSYQVEQKREHVRVNADFEFYVIRNEKYIKCRSINISAGGIAFSSTPNSFLLDDEAQIVLPLKEFSKQIKCGLKIVKILNEKEYAAQFVNLNPHDENKIVKRIFEYITLNNDV